MRAWSITVALIAALGLTVWGGFGLCGHLIVAVDKWGAAATQATQAAQTINKPKSGTLSEVDDTLFQARLTIDAVNKVAIHEQHQLVVLDAQERQLFADLHDTASSAQSTLAGITTTAYSASGALDAANGTILAARPVLASLSATGDASTRTLDALNARITDPQIDHILGNVAAVTDSGNGIMLDARKISDYETAQFLKPVRWYMQPIKKSSDILDIGAAIARHVP